jgi:hypothetical protein
VSAIVLIGVLGTLLSTVQTLPHLAAALRTRVPSGSALGWTLSLAGTSMWCLDGLLTHNFWLAAPTVVTFPVFSVLSFMSWRSMPRRQSHGQPVASAQPTIDLAAEPAAGRAYGYRLDDTLELPRLAGV